MTEAQKLVKKFEVKQTTDYGQFKYLIGNRSVNKKHVQELIKSFEKTPELANLRPILVNENLEIIDGQHNLQASEALKRLVSYVVVPGLTLETAQLLNAYQKPWNLVDYAKILDMCEEYKVSISTAAIYLAGGQARGRARYFKLGEFVIADEAIARERIEMLTDFSEFGSWWSTRSFVIAFWTVVKFDNYDHQRLLEGARNSMLRRQSTRIDYLRDMERAYNFGRPASSVRFF